MNLRYEEIDDGHAFHLFYSLEKPGGEEGETNVYGEYGEIKRQVILYLAPE